MNCGVLVNYCVDDGCIVLRVVVSGGYIDVVFVFLDYFVEVDLVDDDKRIVLRGVLWGGYSDVVL